MGPRAMHNIAVLELPSSVEFMSTLEGLHFGTNCEITQVIEHLQVGEHTVNRMQKWILFLCSSRAIRLMQDWLQC